MEENSSRAIIHKSGSRKTSNKGPKKKCHRSGDCCGSCMAALVADCVALCCCPCAILSFLSLTFFKAPWMVGKRCLGRGKKERKCEKIKGGDKNVNSTNLKVTEGISEIVKKDGQIEDAVSRCESEGVSIEMYQLGNLGFCRGSFTGI